ncbi:MAG: sugar phosphate isomerase/epimerase, partial [Candidatus Latescibacterota bacterium]|nr:sugar phosphate isomerase/epimerase [Candidatus Latescibacterota bacterium]
NLYLLMDSGHLQISREDPASVIAQAGDRLGYVHLDDNDGKDDLHWALCDGVLTRTDLRELLVALTQSPYMGPVSLELHPELKNPFESLRKSLHLVREILGELP